MPADGVALLTLNRPQAANAFNTRMGEELGDFWKKEMGSVIKHSPELKKIAWDQYQLLDEGPIHIVVVKIGASYKLVFWENVNQLLKESRGTAPTKASDQD